MSRKSVLAASTLPAILAICALIVAPGTAVAGGKPKPTGVFKARIGWFYTDSPDFPQTKVGPAVFHWPSCAKAGGVKMQFPADAHLYEGDNGGYKAKEAPIAGLSGPPLDPQDPFTADLYVGDLAQPGMKTLTVKCLGQVHGHLQTLFTGPLKTDYVRKDNQLTPKSLFSLDVLDLFGTEPTTESSIVRSCSEPGTPSITISSPAVAAGPKGGSYVTLPASDILGTFEGTVTPSSEAPPGDYEAVVSCGSGRVGVGVVGLG